MKIKTICAVLVLIIGTGTGTGPSHNEHYTLVERGSAYTDQYWLYFKDGENYISPWHDVPLYYDESNQHFNMICEIPRGTNAKMEISKEDLLNPIKQDMKNGQIRFVHNIHPYKGYMWNYGALPQTWENENYIDPDTKAKGDNDPIDICEIGSRVAKRGDIYPVKILGIIGLIDEGETDWKLIGINANDPLAKNMSDIYHIEKYIPELLDTTREWLRIYKMPTGKPANQFAFDGQYRNRSFAHKIIKETHQFWKDLVEKGGSTGLNTYSAEYSGAKNHISQDKAKQEVESKPEPGEPAPIDPEVRQFYYPKNELKRSDSTGTLDQGSH